MRVDEPIAEDVWSYETVDGVTHVARIVVGRPQADQHGWVTPVSIAGLHDDVKRVSGMNAIESLANAGAWIREVFAAYSEVSPRADEPELLEREPAGDDWRPKVTHIDDPIADDVCSFKTANGVERVRVVVGRPCPNQNDGNRTWYTPMFVEASNEKVMCTFGVGAIDSLANVGLRLRALSRG